MHKYQWLGTCGASCPAEASVRWAICGQSRDEDKMTIAHAAAGSPEGGHEGQGGRPAVDAAAHQRRDQGPRIALRGDGRDGRGDGSEILQILGKMVKQRQESVRAYEEGGRLELAEKERAEIGVIEEFLPRQLAAEEVGRLLMRPLPRPGRRRIRDMGKVMGS